MTQNTDIINISRVRRAIDYWPEFTGGERLVAGVIADHFNAKEGYAFPTYRYLEFVYGFSSDTISSAISKMRDGLMKIRKARKGNNCYEPDMQKVEAVLDDLETARQRWHAQKDASSDEAGLLRTAKQGASSRKARVRRKTKRNVQPKAQHNAQPQSPTFSPPSAERGQTGSGSGKGRPSGAADDDYLDQIDFSACVDELQKILPAYEPFGDYNPMDQKALDRSRRGAIRELEKLAHLGWTLDEIRQYIDAYLRDYDKQAKSNFKRNGQCGRMLSGLLVSLVNQCDPETRNNDDGEMYGWNIPDRFLRKPEQNQPQAASNDNRAEPERKVSGIDWENDPPF